MRGCPSIREKEDFYRSARTAGETLIASVESM